MQARRRVTVEAWRLSERHAHLEALARPATEPKIAQVREARRSPPRATSHASTRRPHGDGSKLENESLAPEPSGALTAARRQRRVPLHATSRKVTLDTASFAVQGTRWRRFASCVDRRWLGRCRPRRVPRFIMTASTSRSRRLTHLSRREPPHGPSVTPERRTLKNLVIVVSPRPRVCSSARSSMDHPTAHHARPRGLRTIRVRRYEITTRSTTSRNH